jgi:hypothetical protein
MPSKANDKIYGLPDGWRAPGPDAGLVEGRFDPDTYANAVELFLDGLRAWLRDMGYREPMAGRLVRWQTADGYAEYMIISLRQLALMHLPLGDGYRMPRTFERGLTAAAVREAVVGYSAATVDESEVMGDAG